MTGLLPEDAIVKALAALERFRVLCDTMRDPRYSGGGDGRGARCGEWAGISRLRRARDRLQNRAA